MMMKNSVLITGGLGFIGRNIAKFFKERNYYVVGIGHGNLEFADVSSDLFDEWHESSLNIEALSKIAIKAGLVIHCAGGSTVGKSLVDPYADYHKTVNSTLELLEYIRLFSPDSTVFYLSTAAVYGVKGDLPILECSETAPISPYGFHKLASENICRSYSMCFGISVSIIRLFSIYGEGLTKQLLWEACNKISNSTGDIEFYGTGDETRDWLHADDVSSLIWRLSEFSTSKFSVYNGAFGQRITVKEIIHTLARLLNKSDIEIKFNNRTKSGDPKYYLASTEKVSEIGWLPTIHIKEGLERYVNWFNSNKND